MSKNTLVEVKDLTKTFRIPLEASGGIKQKLINVLKGRKGYRNFSPLNDISFEIHEGDFFGIVGRNGSGKSTLLKTIAGIYVPNKGAVGVQGRLVPFIELGVGFNPELSGRENVYLNGALLGFGHKEVDSMYDDIVAFAELGDFMEERLKNYSSGMQVRLAFSIAIQAKGDILLLDEVLAVGDAAFQRKCFNYFEELKKNKKTVILVTHDMGNVERFCNRVLVLDEGKIHAVTTPEEASIIYSTLNVDKKGMREKDAISQKMATQNGPTGTGELAIDTVTLVKGGEKSNIFRTGEPFSVDIRLRQLAIVKNNYSVGLAIHNIHGEVVAGPNADNINIPKGCLEVIFNIDKMPITGGEYSITVSVYDKDTRETIDILYKSFNFSIISSSRIGGMVNIEGVWKTK